MRLISVIAPISIWSLLGYYPPAATMPPLTWEVPAPVPVLSYTVRPHVACN